MNTETGGLSRRPRPKTTRGAGRRTATELRAQRGTPPRFSNLRLGPALGSISYTDEAGLSHGAKLVLLLIREAWSTGCNFEDLADGFGPGAGTLGDWSAIRDSTGGATERMLERALNHLLPGARG